jgi:hypothetical protein
MKRIRRAMAKISLCDGRLFPPIIAAGWCHVQSYEDEIIAEHKEGREEPAPCAAPGSSMR